MSVSVSVGAPVRLIAWRNAIFLIFALNGLALASWLARVPAARDALEASTAQMGLLFSGASIGSIAGLTASSHIIARIGAARTMAWCLGVGGIGVATIGVGATVGSVFAVVFAGMILFGCILGICDVAMNVSGAANEKALGKTIMPIFHAFFSIGTMIGAGIGALAEKLDVPIVLHLGVIAVIFAAVGILSTRWVEHEETLSAGQTPVAADDPSRSWRGRLSIWGQPATILIGLIILGMAFTEGSAGDWLALAMVDGHGVSNATGAVVFGVFVTAMTVGRLCGVLLLDRFGRVPVLRGSAVLAAIGLLAFITTNNDIVAITGVVLWGLGAALGFPVGMSAAADDPKTAAARVSAVATIGYLAFLVGPPLIGFLGEHFGLLNALLVVLVLVALSGAVSHAAREPRSTPDAP